MLLFYDAIMAGATDVLLIPHPRPAKPPGYQGADDVTEQPLVQHHLQAGTALRPCGERGADAAGAAQAGKRPRAAPWWTISSTPSRSRRSRRGVRMTPA